MKGVIFRILFALVGALILILFSLWLLETWYEAYSEESTEILSKLEIYRPYSFDINDLLSDVNDPNSFDSFTQNNYFTSGADPQFCKDLRNCLKMSFEKGVNCAIKYKVKPNTPFDPDIVYNAVRNCPITDVKISYRAGYRTMCTFDGSKIQQYNKIREDNTSLIIYEPYIHNCYLPENLGTHNVIDGTDQVNYLYSGRGSENGYDFKNGGMVRIVVTNISVKDDAQASCSFSLYACGQNAIARFENETPVEIFKKIRDLPDEELYYSEEVAWAGPAKDLYVDLQNWLFCKLFCYIILGIFCDPLNPCGPAPTFPTEANIYGYHPRVYNFTFEGTYNNKEAIIDAIDAGIWEWNKRNYMNKEKMKYFIEEYYPDIERIYFSYSPIVNIFSDSSLNSNCWNVEYQHSNINDRTKLNSKGDADIFADSSSLYHIFNFSTLPFNFNNGDKIKMVLGIKKIFITGKTYTVSLGWFGSYTGSILGGVRDRTGIDDLESRVILVFDPITICKG